MTVEAAPSSGYRQERDQDIVRRTAELLAANLSTSEFFEKLCGLIRRFVDAPVILIARTTHGISSVEHLGVGDRFGKPVDPAIQEDSWISRVALEGKPRLLSGEVDLPAADQAPALPGPSVAPAARCAIFVPLKFGREIVGALSLQSPQQDAYDQSDLELIETCALYVGVQVQQARLESEKAALEALAMTDALTGAANRRFFDFRFGEEWKRAARSGRALSLVIVDVDFFKAFNDLYGHVAGDACLQQIARALGQCTLRPGDVLARYGGEELAAILPDTEAEGAIIVAERMRAAVAGLEIMHGASKLNVVSISCGAATCHATSDLDKTSLVRLADAALYKAKSGGRNRVVAEDYVSDAEPAYQRLETLGNLPSQLTSFLGREAEIAELKRLLASSRFVMLAGAGGVGKTRLALRVAEATSSDFRDGLCYVDLSVLTDDHLIAPTAATMLGLRITPHRTSLELVCEFLRNKRMLLILDNCEHLIDGCAELATAILRSAPSVRILAGSRQPLDIGGEAILRIPPMRAPEAATSLSASQAMWYEAVALFVDRAKAASNFVLTDNNAPFVARVCRHLDGIPLAIELAAARTSFFEVEQLAERLDNRFNLLAGGSRSAAPRQKTLRALIDWSYDLLSSEEQALFRRLSVFPGTFTVRGVAAVCGVEGAAESSIVAGLASLVDKSLVFPEMLGAERRYRLLESTREYALEKLAETDELAAYQARHLRFFTDVARRADLAYGGREWQRLRPQLESQVDDFRAALEWSFGKDGDPRTGAALAVHLAHFWRTMPWYSGEGRKWLQRAMDAGSFDAHLQAHVYGRLSRLTNPALTVGSRECIALSKRALKLYRDLGDRAGMAGSLYQIGTNLAGLGELDEGRRVLEDALAIYRDIDDKRGLADVTNGLAMLATFAGDYARSAALYQECTECLRDIEDDHNLGRVIGNLGDAAYLSGEYDKAVSYARTSLTIFERYHDRWGIGWQFTNLGMFEIARANYDAAVPALHKAVDQFRDIQDDWFLAASLELLARVAVARGNPVRAARILGFTQKMLEKADVPRQPADQKEHDRILTALNDALGETSLAVAMQAGRMLSLDEAVGEARAA